MISSYDSLTIGELARQSGVPASTIRYYERRGLLPAPERSGGWRRYEPSALDLLAAIGVAKAAGFSLVEVERLFRGFDAGTSPSERWAKLAEDKLAELDAQSARIDAMRSLLREGLRCGCLSLEECRLVRERLAKSSALA